MPKFSLPHSLFKIVFIYFWLCRVFIAMHGLSLVFLSGDYSLVVVYGLLTMVASIVVEHGL